MLWLEREEEQVGVQNHACLDNYDMQQYIMFSWFIQGRSGKKTHGSREDSVGIGARQVLVGGEVQRFSQVGNVVGGQGNFPAAARGVERIGGHGHAGNMSNKASHNRDAGVDGGPEMAGAARQIGLKKIVGFDPNLHQAISMLPSDQEANTVVSVLQKGYLIADRVLRPALVTVAAPK